LQAQTREVKARASPDLNSRGPHKPRPRGQRFTQAQAGRLKVWAREDHRAAKVSRSKGESNQGGQVESRGPPEVNKGEWKQSMMCL